MMLLAVLAAIALIWNVARRSAHRATAPLARAQSVESVENPAQAPESAAAAAAPELAPAADAPASAIEQAGAAQADIARVVTEGRPGLTTCYQRALARDNTLVQGEMTVRLSVASSGRVGAVNISGPAAFRALQPCLKEAIARWTFPAAAEPYAAQFALVFRGKE